MRLMKNGKIVEVSFGDNKYDGVMQGAGYGVGFSAAVVKMATVDVLALVAKKASETEFGQGVSHGYQDAYFKRDLVVEKVKMKKAIPEPVLRELGTKVIGPEAKNQDINEIVTVIATMRIRANDKEGKNRFPALHVDPMKIVTQAPQVQQVPSKPSLTDILNKVVPSAPMV